MTRGYIPLVSHMFAALDPPWITVKSHKINQYFLEQICRFQLDPGWRQGLCCARTSSRWSTSTSVDLRCSGGLSGTVVGRQHNPRVWCLRGIVLYPNLSRINFLGPSFFRNKFPFPKKGTTPRRTWYTKNIQNQFWDHGGKHLWVKFQWPRLCLSLCKSPKNTAPRNSTLSFACNPSVDEYFYMGQQPPWTLKMPKWGWINFLEG